MPQGSTRRLWPGLHALLNVLQWSTMKEAHVVVRIEPKQLEKLKRMAKKDDRSISWLIRKAIDRLLEGKHAR
jgi:hypothetical protein